MAGSNSEKANVCIYDFQIGLKKKELPDKILIAHELEENYQEYIYP